MIGNTLISLLLTTCYASPRTPRSTGPSTTPTVSPIPWPTKIDTFRAYILQQPDQNGTEGFGHGPFLRKTFDDGQCLQLDLYDWECTYEIPYKMRGIAEWLENSIPRDADPI